MNEAAPAQDHSKKFSPSKLSCYKDCARRYKFRYVDRIKRDSHGVEAFLGDSVHKTFESLYEDVQHGKLPSVEELLSRFDAHWDAGFDPKLNLRKYTAAEWREVGRRCVRDYYAAHHPFDEDRTVVVEGRVGFELPIEGETVRIEGFVDRLALGKDGAFEIHDYKTGRTLPSQEDVDEDWQLAIYDIAVREKWTDASGVRLMWHYVQHGKTLVSRRSQEQLAALKAEISALVSRIKRDNEFAPNESALCNWCEYRDLCPLFAHAEQSAAGAPLASDGAALVDRLAALDARKKELRGEIKALELQEAALEEQVLRYADAHKYARVSGALAEATVVEKNELKLPTKTASPKHHEELEAALKALPIWPEVSHVDAHRLVSAYEGGAWGADLRTSVGELLARFGRAVKQRTLRLRRRKEEDE